MTTLRATLPDAAADGKRGAIGLGFYQPGPGQSGGDAAASRLRGRLLVDLDAGEMRFGFDGRGSLPDPSARALPSRPAGADGFRLTLTLAKADDFPKPGLAPSVAGVFRWVDRGGRGLGDGIRTSIRLIDPDTRDPLAPAANGRLSLLATPGTTATITQLVLR